MTQRLRLGVNIDHVATIRNARGESYPDPARAAEIAIAAGADGITAHLREDRRHISDADIDALAALTRRRGRPLNFEMAVTDEMQAIALRHRPHAVCLVPERREEVTTEGGLDVIRGHNAIAPLVRTLREAGARMSLFVEADPAQIAAAREVGAQVIELHTGAYCDAVREDRPDAARHLEGLAGRRGAGGVAGPGGPCRPRSGFRDGRADRPHPAGGRAEHRPFPHRRGDLQRPGPGHPAHAQPDGSCAADRPGAGGLIVGIGSDLCDIRRIEKTLDRFGERFTGRIFTELERTRSERKTDRASSYAKRFAAKEACAKALGTGLKRGVFWRDMGVANLRSGQPTMALTGGAAQRLAQITPAGMSAVIHLSLTDDHPYAQAFVIIEAVLDAGSRGRRVTAAGPFAPMATA